MKTILLVLAFALALLLPGASFAAKATAADLSADRGAPNYTQTPGQQSQTWTGPGTMVTSESLSRGAALTAVGTSFIVSVLNTPALMDGRKVGVTAVRTIGAAALAASLSEMAIGLGVGYLLLHYSGLGAWISGDTTGHIRIAPDGQSTQLNLACSVSPCYSYLASHGLAQSSLQAACDQVVAYWKGVNPGWTVTDIVTAPTLCVVYVNGGGFANENVTRVSSAPTDPNWLPASMNDIAPYMTPRPPPSTLIPAMLADGVAIPSSSPGLTTTTPPPTVAPQVNTTKYPAPPDNVFMYTQAGNPYALPDNTPTAHIPAGPAPGGAKTSGSQTVFPGAPSSQTGGRVGAPPVLGPLSSPSSVDNTSSYNPATNTTTTNTRVSTASLTVVQTQTMTDNINNTPPLSIVNSPVTTATVVTNDKTGAQTTATSATQAPAKSAADAPPGLCDLYPNILACAMLGDPPAPDPLVKTTVPMAAMVTTAFAGGGGCPAALPFSVYGHSYSISYQPLCDKLIILKFIFMALAAVAAAYILADSFRIQ